MLVPFLIMLREGIEAALIVGIIASYLRQTGRGEWMPAVWIGVFLAGALALFVGGGLEMVSAEFPQKQQELFEGLVGLLAVIILSSMVFWMRKVARSIKHELHVSLDAALAGSKNQTYALIGMVFFAVAREGLETVFFLLAVFQQSEGVGAPLGALLGLLLAIGVGIAIYKGSMRLNLSRFFRWTGLFILVVAAGILANSVQALHEAGLWNHFQTVVFDISATLPMDGPTGSVLAGMFGYQDAPTISTLTVYLVYLIGALVLFFLPHAPVVSLPTKPAHLPSSSVTNK
ncbi:high-affinity iron transporter [Pseudomonas sp. JUb42]|jgi:high-affinity iron transporter|uniref:iron uptake transporter permease EfeU n=1 Tax=Pseudomonas sp. JUb42 TaxID=2940611 RepID=UPI002167FA80|nr:iron uptake transporter permease EfeU [Pseudomonas sp. JUb42]MCS3468303.1 high-affinity iron transporter [Pseudomonas sp. JUb42]